MKVTYDLIEKETRQITDEFLNSKQEIPSPLDALKFIKYHIAAYFFFVFVSFFTWSEEGVAIWFGILVFGVFNWFFHISSAMSVQSIFSRISSESFGKYIILKLLKKKILFYSIVWMVFIVLAGIISVLSQYNIAALVVGNFVFTIFLAIIFNVDVSRYQISTLWGALKAAKENYS